MGELVVWVAAGPLGHPVALTLGPPLNGNYIFRLTNEFNSATIQV